MDPKDKTPQMVENLKSAGRFVEAGKLAREINGPRAYGCHYGMRSTRDRAIREFLEGYDAKPEEAKNA